MGSHKLVVKDLDRVCVTMSGNYNAHAGTCNNILLVEETNRRTIFYFVFYISNVHFLKTWFPVLYVWGYWFSRVWWLDRYMYPRLHLSSCKIYFLATLNNPSSFGHSGKQLDFLLSAYNTYGFAVPDLQMLQCTIDCFAIFRRFSCLGRMLFGNE